MTGIYGVSEGDRVKLVYTSDEYTQLTPGDEGVVTGIRETVVGPGPAERQRKVWVEWDSGSRLAMIAGEDEIEVVEDG